MDPKRQRTGDALHACNELLTRSVPYESLLLVNITAFPAPQVWLCGSALLRSVSFPSDIRRLDPFPASTPQRIAPNIQEQDAA